MYRVYIAGKYSDDNVISTLDNIKLGIKMGAVLVGKGFAPFCPFLDYQFQFFNDLSIEQYKAYSMAWVDVCDAMILLPNWARSEGAKAEIEHAHILNIPIFTTVEALDNWRYMKEVAGDTNKT